MAAPISASPLRATDTPPGAGTPNYTPALASLTVLFFMMGFITCLNDILIPYLKAIFQLSYTQANLINLCFFGAYFVMGIPAGKLVQRIGYKGGMLAGFLVAALGAFLFYPAADSRSYALFLGALFVLATGVVLLQVAGNPYVSILGPAKSAPARLTLTQAFNSLGTTVAPLLGSALILSNLPDLDTATSAAAIDVKAVQIPYLCIGAVLIVISVLLGMLKLPVITHAHTEEDSNRRAYHYRHLVFGVIGIFAYVGGEVAIGSHIVNYLNLDSVMPTLLSYVKNMVAAVGLQELVNPQTEKAAAGVMVSFYWFGAMVGRFMGAYLLNKVGPGRLLAFNALGAVVLVLVSMSTTGEIAMWSLLTVGLMNSIMFATIFTLAVAGLGRNTEEASGLLNVGIVGGAVIPLLFGMVADASSLRWAFILPVFCYAYIMWYGLKGHKPSAA